VRNAAVTRMIDLDIRDVGSDKGQYDDDKNVITIFLRKIWFEAVDTNITMEDTLIQDIIETANHEFIHAAIGEFIGKDIDDHKIFKYLYV
jgi:hypothetical protein